ncbi:MAG: hypothetical protein QXK71_06695 [Pyrobaculum sp.]
MRGVIVSIQVAILISVMLVIVFALASYLYTTLYATTQYVYIAVTDAYVYPVEGGVEMKVCISTGGVGSVRVVYVELNGVAASSVRLYSKGVETSEIEAGSTGYLKAVFQNVKVYPGQLPTGRLVVEGGFSFVFTPRVFEGVCVGE